MSAGIVLCVRFGRKKIERRQTIDMVPGTYIDRIGVI